LEKLIDFNILIHKLTEFDLTIKSISSIYVFKNQNSSNVICALKIFKIDIDIAIEKTHCHADRIRWAI
jgi:hypothetical protein